MNSIKDLLGLDISSGMGWDTARAINLFRLRCPLYVEGAAKMVERQLNSEPAEEPDR